MKLLNKLSNVKEVLPIYFFRKFGRLRGTDKICIFNIKEYLYILTKEPCMHLNL